MELGYELKPKLHHRINWRLIVLVTAVSLPFLGVAYVVVDQRLSNGIHRYANYAQVDLKSLGNFPFDAVNGRPTDVPSEFRALDGHRVKLEGKMYTASSAGKVSQFQFVYDIAKCCFGGPPKVQERVFVSVPNAGKIDFHDEEVQITGRLHVRLQRDSEGTVISVYDMDLEQVGPV